MGEVPVVTTGSETAAAVNPPVFAVTSNGSDASNALPADAVAAEVCCTHLHLPRSWFVCRVVIACAHWLLTGYVAAASGQ